MIADLISAAQFVGVALFVLLAGGLGGMLSCKVFDVVGSILFPKGKGAGK